MRNVFLTNIVCIIIIATVWLVVLYYASVQQKGRRYLKKRIDTVNITTLEMQGYGSTKKPQWVIDEVIRLKALLPKAGCRTIANTFNRLHNKQVTVGKSFVAECIQRHQYQILHVRRTIKNKLPTLKPINHTWAMDLSFYTGSHNTQQPFVGIIDHGSRALIRLQSIINKNSWTLLGHLCLAIGKYGKPQKLRTDNERIFTSYVFTTCLKWVGIKYQRIPTASPWCNGIIERLFGTLKPLLKQLNIPNKSTLQLTLNEFKQFYNHVRPHQSLQGKTPSEVWHNLDTNRPIKTVVVVKALDGLMVGFKIRR